MRRVRNSRGRLEDYGGREIELPPETETPQGWVRADSGDVWAPSADVVFDGRSRPRPVQQVPLTGLAAVAQILKFFNLAALAERGRLTLEKKQEQDRLDKALRDAVGPDHNRTWMRIPVQVDVLLGSRQTPARVSDISAGGMRMESVQGRFMFGTRLDIVMGFAVGQRSGVVIFPSRVAWVNEMRQTLGTQFTDRPRWEDR